MAADNRTSAADDTASPADGERADPRWPGRAFCALCGLVALLQLGSSGLALTLRAHLQAQLGLWLLAGLVWLLALLMLKWAPPLRPGGAAERRVRLWIWAVALAMRLPALALPTGHSDDVHRYLWDGAAQVAGLSPYAGAPEAAVYAPLQQQQTELLLRINHRHLPTIYPPAAQAAFWLNSRLGGVTPDWRRALLRWRLLVGSADLLVLLLLWRLCRRTGRDPRLAAMWGVSPLPATELWLNGHLDSIGLVLLLLALQMWPRDAARPPGGTRALVGAAASGALLAAALLIKPVAAALAPAALRLQRRMALALLLGGLGAAVLCTLPYARAGAQMLGSLGEYSRRWRSNDGAYALLQRGTEAAVARLYPPPHYTPWRHPRLAQMLTGRARDTVWPDELAAALARALVLTLLLVLAGLGVRWRLPPARMGLLLLTAYLLWSPTLHPWYLLWPLVLCPLWPQAAPPVLVMTALAPLAYAPLADFWAGRGYHEAVLPRLCEHLGGWMAVAWVVFRARWPERLH